MTLIDLKAERRRRPAPPPPKAAGPVVDLRDARLLRANDRLRRFDAAAAAEDILAARFIVCGRKLPGATLAEIAIMVRYAPGRDGEPPPTRGATHVSRSSSKPRSKPRPQQRRRRV